MTEAKKTYTKKSGGSATHVMPDGVVHTGKTHTAESKVVSVPETKQEKKEVKKQDRDNKEILSDILDSYDSFNKNFQDISNSDNTKIEKKTNYNNEKTRLENYHTKTKNEYVNILSKEMLVYMEQAYDYAIDSFKIGSTVLQDGVPKNRVEFEDFDEPMTIQVVIDKAIEAKPDIMDNYKSFYAEEIPEHEPIDKPLKPFYGDNSTLYPHSGGVKDGGAYHGGKSKKIPKKSIIEMTKDLFIRDMKKKLPDVSLSKILEVYKKHKDKIEDTLLDAVIKLMVSGGQLECGPNQYKAGEKCYTLRKEFQTGPAKTVQFKEPKKEPSKEKTCSADEFKSGDKCYKKEKKQTGQFDRKKYIEDHNLALEPEVTPLKPIPKENKSEIAQVFDGPSVRKVTHPLYVEPKYRGDGPIFGTNEGDLTDPRSYADAIANIAVKTFDGLKSVWDVVGPLAWFI